MGRARIPRTMVQVNVAVKINGHVKTIKVITKTTNSTQNKAAARAVELASPFPKFPPQILDDELEMTIPAPIDWLYTTELDRAGLL